MQPDQIGLCRVQGADQTTHGQIREHIMCRAAGLERVKAAVVLVRNDSDRRIMAQRIRKLTDMARHP